MKALLDVVGVILAAIGIVWILQGTNVFPGGFMGGQILWAIIGAVALVVGVALVAFANRRSRLTR
ncbi:MAG TPA: hypothetical protein VGA61_19905 [Anaerolineae bacterium]